MFKQRSIGTIVVEERRLIVETTSQKRADRARDWLSTLLGDAARFRTISYEDVRQALKRGPPPGGKNKSEIPPEVQAEVLGKFYDDHYRNWFDEPVPALGNRTPSCGTLENHPPQANCPAEGYRKPGGAPAARGETRLRLSLAGRN